MAFWAVSQLPPTRQSWAGGTARAWVGWTSGLNPHSRVQDVLIRKGMPLNFLLPLARFPIARRYPDPDVFVEPYRSPASSHCFPWTRRRSAPIASSGQQFATRPAGGSAARSNPGPADSPSSHQGASRGAKGRRNSRCLQPSLRGVFRRRLPSLFPRAGNPCAGGTASEWLAAYE